MCRLLAYAGPVRALESLLTAPPHSLVAQSYRPREMTAGLLNADGYGFAWYGVNGEAPYTYRHTVPIWSDGNLDSLGRYITAGHLLAYVRSATPGQGLDMANTQPFVHGRWSFVHNGFVDGFSKPAGVPLRRALQSRLDDTHWPLATGGTDSGHLFAWLMQALNTAEQGGELASLADALGAFGTLPGLERAGLNFLLSNGHRLIAGRHAIGTDCPTLYHLEGDDAFPGGLLIASEPLFDSPQWRALPPNSLTLTDLDDRTADQTVAL